jgi:hypothetical protein
LTGCGGGSSGGDSGNGGDSGTGNGGTTPSGVIPANGTILRTIMAGDQITYNLTVTAKEYDWDGTVLAEDTFDTTADFSYFTSNMPLLDDTPMMLERRAFGDGTVADSHFAQDSDGSLYQFIDENGYYYFDIDYSLWGMPFLFSPLEPHTAWSGNYHLVSGDRTERVGVRTVSVGGISVVNTPMGRIEAYRVILTDSEDAGFGLGEIDTETLWINPEIGIVRIEAVYQAYLGDLVISSTEIVAGITSVNFTIPAAE